MSAGVHQRRVVPLLAIGAVSDPSLSLRKKVARLKPSVFHATESGTAFGGRDVLIYGTILR